MIAIFVLPHDCRLNKVIFMYTMGSLLWAVPIWRNSLVFHDVDKVGGWVGKGVISVFCPHYIRLFFCYSAVLRLPLLVLEWLLLGVLCSFFNRGIFLLVC